MTRGWEAGGKRLKKARKSEAKAGADAATAANSAAAAANVAKHAAPRQCERQHDARYKHPRERDDAAAICAWHPRAACGGELWVN